MVIYFDKETRTTEAQLSKDLDPPQNTDMCHETIRNSLLF